jgi:hypothetical protein
VLSVSRYRLDIHERHFSYGVWIYLGLGNLLREKNQLRIWDGACASSIVRWAVQDQDVVLRNAGFGRLAGEFPSAALHCLVFAQKKKCKYRQGVSYKRIKLNRH